MVVSLDGTALRLVVSVTETMICQQKRTTNKADNVTKGKKAGEPNYWLVTSFLLKIEHFLEAVFLKTATKYFDK